MATKTKKRATSNAKKSTRTSRSTVVAGTRAKAKAKPPAKGTKAKATKAKAKPPAKAKAAKAKPVAKARAKGPKGAARGGTANSAFMKPMRPDAALARVVGEEPLPRSEVTKRVWAYIKKRGLQDAKDRRSINADDMLGPILDGRRKVTMFELTKHVNNHLS